MKKLFPENTDIDKENKIDDQYINNQIKTTDVNILLNRVRLDKRKIFRKKLFIALIFILSVSTIIAFTIL